MTQSYFMGIDGGGSTLRVVITNDELVPIAEHQSSAANPSTIGHSKASTHIRQVVQNTLKQANLNAANICAVGIGIAGASNQHSEPWLRGVISPALPDSLVVPSSDLEIALVGSLGQRHGILILAGTGSAVFGVPPSGESLQLGGWGYLLGDEGSGYWIGLQAIKRVIRDYEQHYYEFIQYSPNSLNHIILKHLNLQSPRDLIRWLYRSEAPPVSQVAPLAKLIIDHADYGNWDAINLLQCVAIHLAKKTKLMKRRLNYANAPIAFAGGLLENDNRLSRELSKRLNLSTRPKALHSAVVGGALLAQLEWKAQNQQ